MSTSIEVNGYDNGVMKFSSRLPVDPAAFMSLNAGSLLDFIKDKQVDTAFYAARNSANKEDTLVFLVTKDQFLIDELKMKSPKEKRTQELFNEKETPIASSFEELLDTFAVDQTESDFLLEKDGERYSFKVAYGVKANNILLDTDRYMDEFEMFKEVEEKMKIEDAEKPVIKKSAVLSRMAAINDANQPEPKKNDKQGKLNL